MNKRQALSWAKKRYGKTAFVDKGVCYPYVHGNCTGLSAHGPGCHGNRVLYRIGYVALGLFNSIVGVGTSWEKAVERASKRCF